LAEGVCGSAIPEDGEPGDCRGNEHDDRGQQGDVADGNVEQPGDREHEGPDHQT
jgi:hypothetical protein